MMKPVAQKSQHRLLKCRVAENIKLRRRKLGTNFREWRENPMVLARDGQVHSPG